MKYFRKARSAFTMMEVVIVIVIIAILMGAGVSVYASVLTNARKTAAFGQISADYTYLCVADTYQGITSNRVDDGVIVYFDGKHYFSTTAQDAKITCERPKDIREDKSFDESIITGWTYRYTKYGYCTQDCHEHFGQSEACFEYGYGGTLFNYEGMSEHVEFYATPAEKFTYKFSILGVEPWIGDRHLISNMRARTGETQVIRFETEECFLPLRAVTVNFYANEGDFNTQTMQDSVTVTDGGETTRGLSLQNNVLTIPSEMTNFGVIHINARATRDTVNVSYRYVFEKATSASGETVYFGNADWFVNEELYATVYSDVCPKGATYDFSQAVYDAIGSGIPAKNGKTIHVRYDHTDAYKTETNSPIGVLQRLAISSTTDDFTFEIHLVARYEDIDVSIIGEHLIVNDNEAWTNPISGATTNGKIFIATETGYCLPLKIRIVNLKTGEELELDVAEPRYEQRKYIGKNIVSYVMDYDEETLMFRAGEIRLHWVEEPMEIYPVVQEKNFSLTVLDGENKDVYLSADSIFTDMSRKLSGLTYAPTYTFYLTTRSPYIEIDTSSFKLSYGENYISESAYTVTETTDGYIVTVNMKEVFEQGGVPAYLRAPDFSIEIAQRSAEFTVTMILESSQLFDRRVGSTFYPASVTSYTVCYEDNLTFYVNGRTYYSYAPEFITVTNADGKTLSLTDGDTPFCGISYLPSIGGELSAYGRISLDQVTSDCTIRIPVRYKTIDFVFDSEDMLYAEGKDGTSTLLGSTNDCLVFSDGGKVYSCSASGSVSFDVSLVPELETYNDLASLVATANGTACTRFIFNATTGECTFDERDFPAVFAYDKVGAIYPVILSAKTETAEYTVTFTLNGLYLLTDKDITSRTTQLEYVYTHYDSEKVFYINGSNARYYACEVKGLGDGITAVQDGAYQRITVSSLTGLRARNVSASPKTKDYAIELDASSLVSPVGKTTSETVKIDGNSRIDVSEAESAFTFTLSRNLSATPDMEYADLNGILSARTTKGSVVYSVSGTNCTIDNDRSASLIWDYDTVTKGTVTLRAKDFNAISYTVSFSLPSELKLLSTRANGTAIGTTLTFTHWDNEQVYYINGTSARYYASAVTGTGNGVTAEQDGAYQKITVKNITGNVTLTPVATEKTFSVTLDNNSSVAYVGSTYNTLRLYEGDHDAYATLLTELTGLTLGVNTFTVQRYSSDMDGFGLKGVTATSKGTALSLTEKTSATAYYTYSFDTSSLPDTIFSYDTADDGTVVLKANEYEALSFTVTIYLQDHLQVMNEKASGNVVPTASYTTKSNTGSDSDSYPYLVSFTMLSTQTKTVYVNGTDFNYGARNSITDSSEIKTSTDRAYQVIEIIKPTSNLSAYVQVFEKYYSISLDEEETVQTATVGANVNLGTTKQIVKSESPIGNITYSGGSKVITLEMNDSLRQKKYITMTGFTATMGDLKIIDTDTNTGSFLESDYQSLLFDYYTEKGQFITIKAKTLESVKYTVSLTMTGLWLNGSLYTDASGNEVQATNQTTPEMNITNTSYVPDIVTDYFNGFSKTITAHSMFGYVTNGTTKTEGNGLNLLSLGTASQSGKQFGSSYTYYDAIPLTVSWTAGTITKNDVLTVSAVKQYKFSDKTFSSLAGNTATIVPLYFGDTTAVTDSISFGSKNIGAIKYAEGYQSIGFYDFNNATIGSLYFADSLTSVGRMVFMSGKISNMYLGKNTVKMVPFAYHYNSNTNQTTLCYEGKTNSKNFTLSGNASYVKTYNLNSCSALISPATYSGLGSNMDYAKAYAAGCFCNCNLRSGTTYETVSVDVIKGVSYSAYDNTNGSSWSTSVVTYEATAW